MNEDLIKRINEVVADYFKANEEKEWIPIKDIMSDLVNAQVFPKDVKKGLPLRKVLRKLDEQKALDQIPAIHAERKENATYWYLVREGKQFVEKETTNLPSQNPLGKGKDNNDEAYIMNLCDELLGQTSERQFTFENLLGDYHKDGINRTTLPLDAYFEELNLVIELVNKRAPAPVKGKDKGRRKTVSGVNRHQQRLVYQKRKQDFLRNKDIGLVELDFMEFKIDEQNQLIREKEAVATILQEYLKEYIK